MRGFGGVLPWARRMVVEERNWLDGAEFTELVSLCQLLPGPNIVNFSVAFGGRVRGVSGAVAAISGLMAAPMAIVLCLGALYGRYGQVPQLGHLFPNLAAAAAGLVWAMACKMAEPHWRRPLSVLVASSSFLAVAVFKFPLILVVAALAPVSVALHWSPRR